MPHRLLLLTLVLVLVGCNQSDGPGAIPPVPFTGAALVLDAGEGAALDVDAAYDPEQGYGWTVGPADAFVRDDRPKSRDDLTIDGVRAPERLVLRVDLAPGLWRVRFWHDDGLEEAPLLTFEANGQPVDLAWSTFGAPAEPAEGPDKFVRHHASTVEVSPGGLMLSWTRPERDVRLLGVSFLPVADAEPAVLSALEAIKPLGTEHGLFDALLSDLSTRAEAGEGGAALWHDRLTMLDRAEHEFFVLRGYEANNDSTGLSIIQRNVQSIMRLDGLLTDLTPGDPLYDRTLWQRARAARALETELGNRRPHTVDEAAFADLRTRYPADTLLAMYAGERIETDDACDPFAPGGNAFDPAAPDWASQQREALCRIADVAHWWIDHRQIENGELGGKLGDDVEALRQWLPVALAGDRRVQTAWRRLADAVWDSPQIVDGYHEAPIDVEHASEPIADAQPFLLLFPEHADEGLARTEPSARHMRETWTVPIALDAEGQARRHFRSGWFGTYEVDERPPRNRDSAINARAARAVRFYAWATGDATALQTLHEWARAWRDAAARTDKGKPAGLFPASLRSADLALNGDEPTWHQANMFWPFFDWPRHATGGGLYDTHLFVYTLTGDTTLLAPMHASLAYVRQHGPTADANAEAGSPPWTAAALLGAGGLWDAASAWRLASGDDRHDDLLRRYGGAYIQARLSGSATPLTEALGGILSTTRVNNPLLREEAFYTDRLYVSPRGAGGVGDLVAMLTGGLSSESPTFAVTWDDATPAVSRYVADAGPERLRVDLYAHTDAPTATSTRLWSLRPGRYTLRVEPDGGRPALSTDVEIDARGEAVNVSLVPGGSVLTLTPAVDA
ncbi:MAG: hypothetical protein AAGI71_19040 [Bacteroidota bacterium]